MVSFRQEFGKGCDTFHAMWPHFLLIPFFPCKQQSEKNQADLPRTASIFLTPLLFLQVNAGSDGSWVSGDYHAIKHLRGLTITCTCNRDARLATALSHARANLSAAKAELARVAPQDPLLQMK